MFQNPRVAALAGLGLLTFGGCSAGESQLCASDERQPALAEHLDADLAPVQISSLPVTPVPTPAADPVAFQALEELGQNLTAEALPTLRRAIHQPDLATQVRAAELLARLGPAARPALPDLVQALEATSSDFVPMQGGQAKELGLSMASSVLPGDLITALIALGPKALPDLHAARNSAKAGSFSRDALDEVIRVLEQN